MKAWQAIEKEENWLRGNLAQDQEGNAIEPESTKAIRFCALGALHHCYGPNEYGKVYDKVITLLGKTRVDNFISSWNNDPATRHEDVVSLLKELDI